METRKSRKMWFSSNAVILPKCCVFCQNAIVLHFHKNVLFLISIIWSLLCRFNTKTFTFPLPLLPKSVCFVTYCILPEYVTRWPWRHRSMYFTVTGTFVPAYFRSRERKFHRWNFRSLELSFPGTFAPESENGVELSLPLCKICISRRHTRFA